MAMAEDLRKIAKQAAEEAAKKAAEEAAKKAAEEAAEEAARKKFLAEDGENILAHFLSEAIKEIKTIAVVAAKRGDHTLPLYKWQCTGMHPHRGYYHPIFRVVETLPEQAPRGGDRAP